MSSVRSKRAEQKWQHLPVGSRAGAPPPAQSPRRCWVWCAGGGPEVGLLLLPTCSALNCRKQANQQLKNQKRSGWASVPRGIRTRECSWPVCRQEPGRVCGMETACGRGLGTSGTCVWGSGGTGARATSSHRPVAVSDSMQSARQLFKGVGPVSEGAG